MTERAARAIVFGTSSAVLVLEILAGRLMAPYVGVTIEAFTGIIGTVLAAIALGSWWGGRTADRRDPAGLIGPMLVAGGLLALASPLIITAVGPGLRGTDPVQIVMLTALAFFAPALALSAVAPVVVKLRLQDLASTGTVVGGLSAVGTAGALFGTFITGFVLIASFPTRPIIIAVGGILVVAGVVLQIRLTGRSSRLTSTALAVFLLGALSLGVAGPCDIETTYSCAYVQADEGRAAGRVLWLDTARHSYVDLDDPTHLEFRYSKIMAGVMETTTPGDAPVVLSIGGGGMTLPRWVRATYPDAYQTVIEIDGRLVELAEESLGLQPTDIDIVLTSDARIAIHDVDGSIDVVLADAFGGFVVPWHLATTEFLGDVEARMADDGVFIMNVVDRHPSAFVRAETNTAAEVFAHVVVIAPQTYFDGTAGGNFVLVASQSPLDTAALEASVPGDEIVLSGAELAAWIGDASVLTDEFAPVDQLITR